MRNNLTYELLRVPEVATLFRVSQVTIRRWINKKKLPAIKIYKDWMIFRSDVEKIIRHHSEGR